MLHIPDSFFLWFSIPSGSSVKFMSLQPAQEQRSYVQNSLWVWSASVSCSVVCSTTAALMLDHWSGHRFPHEEHTGAPEILAEQEAFISTSAESMQMFQFLNTPRARSDCTKTPPQFLRLSSPRFYSAPFLHGVSWGWKMIFFPRRASVSWAS